MATDIAVFASVLRRTSFRRAADSPGEIVTYVLVVRYSRGADAPPSEAGVGVPGPDGGGSVHTVTQTGRLLLGMLALGQRTGYDIKQIVDKVTRFFWTASYGQIYPELRKLEEQSLIVGRSEPSGARRRTAYRLSDSGSQALTRWLVSDAEPTIELRDEGMLKLFFSDAVPGQQVEIVRAIRERNERKRATLQAVAPLIADGRAGPVLALELGIDCAQSIIDWCTAAERRLAAETDDE